MRSGPNLLKPLPSIARGGRQVMTDTLESLREALLDQVEQHGGDLLDPSVLQASQAVDKAILERMGAIGVESGNSCGESVLRLHTTSEEG